jgi:predicted SAM-dependent methyltransferase
MYMKTVHGTFVGIDDTGALVHIDPAIHPHITLLILEDSHEDIFINTGPMSGYKMVHGASGISFLKDGHFLCAESGNNKLVVDRESVDLWETFHLVSAREDDRSRFYKEVSRLIEENEPVKIYCGCGTIPRLGFLNLDRTVEDPNFMRLHQDQYFIFPFADMGWSIPDSCVDYIFDEDFIEHITQLQQIQFLAETLRVLKPGCYHRVNTPNIITSMKKNSNFEKGFEGVYTGELEWDHISIFSPASLAEMAKLVGYSEVVFTTKDHGVSTFAEHDYRPESGRDNITGNIYADLQK